MHRDRNRPSALNIPGHSHVLRQLLKNLSIMGLQEIRDPCSGLQENEHLYTLFGGWGEAQKNEHLHLEIGKCHKSGLDLLLC